MTYKLYNHLRDVPGYTFAEMAILKDLASISQDDQTVLWGMENLCKSAHCSVRTARRNLRRIEEKTGLIPQSETHGRGQVLNYRFNVGYSPVKHPPVESSPVVPPEHIPPPTNGHAPVPPPPRDPYTPEPLSDEEVKARRAQFAAKRAEIAAKPRPEKKYERPGRTARESARLVPGQSTMGGDTGGDAAP